MAENGGEVRVAIRAVLGQFKSDLSSAAAFLKDTFVPSLKTALQAATAAIVGFAVYGIKEYAGYEKAVTNLTIALKAQGMASKETSEYFVALAENLSSATGASIYSEEEIMGVVETLAKFGIVGDELAGATKAAVNFARATGGLETSARLIGMANLGATERLKRYGIEISATTPKAERFGILLDKLAKFEGAAGAETQSLGGKFSVLKNTFDDIAKAVGKELAGNVKKMIALVIDNKDQITEFVTTLAADASRFFTAIAKAPELKELVQFLIDNKELLLQFMADVVTKGIGLVTTLASMAKEAKGLLDTAKDMAKEAAKTVTTKAGGFLGRAAGAVYGLVKTGSFEGARLGEAVGGMIGEKAGEVSAGVITGEEPLPGAKVTRAKLPPPKPKKIVKSGAGAKKGAGEGPPGDMPVKPSVFEKEWKEAFEGVQQGATSLGSKISMVMGAVQSTLSSGFVSLFTGLADKTASFGEIMKNIMTSFRDMMFKIIADILARKIIAHLAEMALTKAGAVVTIMTEAAKAKAAIMAFFARMGPWGIAAGIGVAAAIGAMIMGYINFAHGGIVDKPTMAMIGETGQKEAVINLESRKGKEALREAGGGGVAGAGLTLNISGMFLEADDTKWEKMVRRTIIPILDNYSLKTNGGRPFKVT